MADAEEEDFVGLFSPLGHLSKRRCRVNGEGEAPAVVCSEVSYRKVLQGLGDSAINNQPQRSFPTL